MHRKDLQRLEVFQRRLFRISNKTCKNCNFVPNNHKITGQILIPNFIQMFRTSYKHSPINFGVFKLAPK